MPESSQHNGLHRQLGLVSVTSIVVANMIGAGIFTTSGLLMSNLGSPRVMLLLWAAGGLVALSGALCYGELAAAFPMAGGEYTFLSRLYHPLPGFLTGWVSFFAGFSAPIAASAIGFTEYLSRAIPGAADATGLEVVLAKKAGAILIIAVFTAVHVRGLELGARVQNVLTALKVGLVIALIALGFLWGQGDFGHFGMGSQPPGGLAGARTLGLSLMWVLFAYSGWNAAAYIGSEIRRPERNLPRALLLGTAMVTVLYLLLNALYIYALAPEEMAGVISVAGLAAARLFGPTAEAAISVLIAVALFSSLSAYMILGPRVYYAMARDGLFFDFAGRIHPRAGVPALSVLLQGAIASLFVLLGTFDQILTYMGFALGIFPLMAVYGVFLVRRRGLGAYRMPGFPVAPLVFISATVMVLALSLLERPVESGIALLTVAAGVPAYLLFRYRRKTTQ